MKFPPQLFFTRNEISKCKYQYLLCIMNYDFHPRNYIQYDYLTEDEFSHKNIFLNNSKSG